VSYDVHEIKDWLRSKGTTMWATFDLHEGDGLTEAATWFRDQIDDLEYFHWKPIDPQPVVPYEPVLPPRQLPLPPPQKGTHEADTDFVMPGQIDPTQTLGWDASNEAYRAAREWSLS
jgi:hypothetical protein